ncbi:hypothetical protein HOK00_00040 [bacterium]|jgi:ABC-type multidrug transport system fused ATPase/permease subunit|nr:hypothetical protein [bacterium]
MLEKKIIINEKEGTSYKQISANTILPNLLALFSFAFILVLGIFLGINIWFVLFASFISVLINFSIGIMTLANIRERDTSFDSLNSLVLKIKMKTIKKITHLNTSANNAFKLTKELEEQVQQISDYLRIGKKLHKSKKQMQLEMETGTFDLENVSDLNYYNTDDISDDDIEEDIIKDNGWE